MCVCVRFFLYFIFYLKKKTYLCFVVLTVHRQAERKQARSPSKRSKNLKRKHSAEYAEDTSDDDISSSQSSQTSQCDVSPDDDVTKDQKTSAGLDQRDEWISALALIELATGIPVQ